RLLTAPRVFELSGVVDGSGPLRRGLDLRTGGLHELSSTTGGPVESVRFASLAQPTTSVLRVRCPKGLRAGPPLLPPADDSIHDQGRSGAASWVRIAASSGGVVAAATQTRTRRGAGSTLDRLAVDRSRTDTPP